MKSSFTPLLFKWLAKVRLRSHKATNWGWRCCLGHCR